MAATYLFYETLLPSPFSSVSDPMFICKASALMVSVWWGTQFRLVVLTQFCRFLFGKIHSLAEKNRHSRLTFSFLALFATVEGATFEEKFFIVFIFFWKEMTLKISVYKLDSVCYSFFRLKWAKVIIKLIDFFFSSFMTTQLMVTHVKKKYQYIINVLQIVIKEITEI